MIEAHDLPQPQAHGLDAQFWKKSIRTGGVQPQQLRLLKAWPGNSGGFRFNDCQYPPRLDLHVVFDPYCLNSLIDRRSIAFQYLPTVQRPPSVKAVHVKKQIVEVPKGNFMGLDGIKGDFDHSFQSGKIKLHIRNQGNLTSGTLKHTGVVE